MFPVEKVLSDRQTPVVEESPTKAPAYRRPEVVIVADAVTLVRGAHGQYGDGVGTWHTDRS